MSAFAKVGRKTLRAAYDYVHTREPDSILTRALWDALSPSPKKKAARASATGARREKREGKADSRREVYAAVDRRAAGRCESCFRVLTELMPGEHDHFFGRARSESVETVWLCCRLCHRLKTEGNPSAEHWATRFAAHCSRFEYAATRRKALDLAAWHEAKKTVGAGRAGRLKALGFSDERAPDSVGALLGLKGGGK